MSNNVSKMINYLVFILLGNAIYGAILYFLVITLARHSLPLAYAANLVFILSVLTIDEIGMRWMRAENINASLKKIKNTKDRELNIRLLRWIMTHYVSFKSFLFVFYIAVLIISQIFKFNSEIAGQDLRNFLDATDYSVIILLAFKDFGEEFLKDKKRSKARLDEFNHYLEEHRDD